MKKAYKAVLVPYAETIAAAPTDEYKVCLFDTEIRLLLAILEPMRWLTRYYGDDMSLDAVEAFVDGIAGKLSDGSACVGLIPEGFGLYVCNDAGTIEHLYGTHYRGTFVWYDTNVEQTAMQLCIAASSDDDPNVCFAIINLVITEGTTPDGLAGTPSGHQMTGCDGATITYHSDLYSLTGTPLWFAWFKHSIDEPIVIEFDVEIA